MNKELKIITTDVGESTAKTYTNSYKRLRKLLNMTDKRKPINKLPLNEVLDVINSVENASSRHAVYIIATKVYNFVDNKDAFETVRQGINKDKREHQKTKNHKLTASLPTYKEINDAIKKETDPRKYITSFIIFKIQTRNMDVALIDIHANKKDKYDENRNHLILDENKVIYIRNKYKTVKKYGQKKNIIKVKKFTEKVKEFLGDNEMKTMFTQRNGNHISPASTASYLKKYIVLGLNEGQVIKAVIRNVEENGDYNVLRRISANRGTTLQLLLTEYDISNLSEPTEVITQNQDVKQKVSIE